MALNVVMLGASRSGKTSILASMLNNLRDQNTDNIINKCFYIKDRSDYDALEDAERIEQVKLQENVDNMRDLLTPPIQIQGRKYVPKMTKLFGSEAPFTYKFDVQTKINNVATGPKITINFHDIPGEYCSIGKFDLVEDLISNAQLLLVAVDVPSMMYAKEMNKHALNTVMNCPEEVLNAVQKLGTTCYDDIADPKKRNEALRKLLKMVIFVPIKCEYWLHNGKRQEIDEEIKRVYNQVITQCKQQENIQTLILPVETIGSCIFDHHSDEDNSLILLYNSTPKSKLYMSEDTINGCAAVRCERLAKGQVRLKNGVIYDLDPSDQLILAKERARHPYCYDGGTKLIPFAWFIPTDSKYAPKYCDFLFTQILRFSIMDFAKRTGQSARQAFDGAQSLMDIIRAIPQYFRRLIQGHTAAYSNVLQVQAFQTCISAIDISNWINENPIVYLVNREDGHDVV